MDARPPQPPEGRLIADALKNSGLSIREASRRAGISYGRWRQIASGVQNVSPGSFAAVRAPAATLAAMARVVGVTPKQLEDSGRPDAAGELRKPPRPEQPALPRIEAAPAPVPGEEAAYEARFKDLFWEANPRDRPTLEAIGRLLDTEGAPLSWATKYEVAARYLGHFADEGNGGKTGTALTSLVNSGNFLLQLQQPTGASPLPRVDLPGMTWYCFR